MSEEWRSARLIPISGIRGTREQEVRATSALLSVLSIVPSYAHAVLKPCGAPLGRVRANVQSFIEVSFEDKKNNRSPRPDGLIRVSRGNSSWTALIEVKTESNQLERDQVESYLDVAINEGFDAVITISNEIPPVLGSHPLTLDKKRSSKVPVHHFSWVRLISMAVMEKEVHGIEDPEQSWILGELIRYLEHKNSGALDFTDMGKAWTETLDSLRHGLVKKSDPTVLEVSTKFDGLIRYICLKLGQSLGVDVTPKLTRTEQKSPEERTKSLAVELEVEQSLSARIEIPGSVGHLRVRCDLRGRQIVTSAEIPASGQARNQTRVNWLLKPLSDELDSVVIEAHGGRRSKAANIADFRGDLRDILPPDFPDITRFTVSQVRPLGLQRTTASKNSFITSVADAIQLFYRTILEQQRAWTAPAPRYKESTQGLEGEDSFTSEEIKSGEDDSSSGGAPEHTP